MNFSNFEGLEKIVMCLVSEKVKFCTCTTLSAEELPHYWILYRFTDFKGIEHMGTPIMPLDTLQQNYELNKQMLESRLNELDAFDKPIKFKPKDQLEIVINNLANEQIERMTFCFIFEKGRWVWKEYEVFELMNRYAEYLYGNLQNSAKH